MKNALRSITVKLDSVYNDWYECCHTQQLVGRLARAAAVKRNFIKKDEEYLEKYYCEVRFCLQ